MFVHSQEIKTNKVVNQIQHCRVEFIECAHLQTISDVIKKRLSLELGTRQKGSSLDCGRKPGYLENRHGEHSNLHREKLEHSCCESTVLTNTLRGCFFSFQIQSFLKSIKKITFPIFIISDKSSRLYSRQFTAFDPFMSVYIQLEL